MLAVVRRQSQLQRHRLGWRARWFALRSLRCPRRSRRQVALVPQGQPLRLRRRRHAQLAPATTMVPKLMAALEA